MSQDHIFKIKSTGKKADGTTSKHVYWTRRNRKSKGATLNKDFEKLKLKKFDPTTGKHEVYKQAKK